jgi:tRNA(adenine34) deaminase
MSKFMNEAIKEAKKAFNKNEVPIGAVIVLDGKIIARGQNSREKSQNAIKHAEIIAIEKACKKLKSWRLENAEMYVTLEPCPMCAGAIANARIRKVVYACSEKTSEDHLCEKILQSNRLNHKVEMEEERNDEASKLLTSFFKQKRQP